MTTTLKTAHTPGPWYREMFNPDLAAIYSHRIVNETNAIADVLATHPDVEAECEANARLIAAAPELLEALRNVIQWLPRVPTPVSPQERNDLAADLDAARAAIAKATG